MQVAQAAANIEARASIARQIVADINDIDNARLIPRSEFNDDDWYVYEADSLMLVRRYSASYRDVSEYLAPGQAAARGMRARYVGIWRIVNN